MWHYWDVYMCSQAEEPPTTVMARNGDLPAKDKVAHNIGTE